MVSTFTPNINLEEPARGDYVGTWDTPMNNNTTVQDLALGGITTISAAAGSVVLGSAQFQCAQLTFGSTLLANMTATFPSSFKKAYSVYHAATGSSAFTITLATTVAGGEYVAIPPGEITSVVSDGINLRFANLGRIGSYWDYAGSSVPSWVSGCSKPPYLLCDGSALSSATYPFLFNQIGGTLPDARGRSRFAVDGGAGRISSAATGFAGSSVGSGGGAQAVTLGSSNLPSSIPYKDPGHTHPYNYPAGPPHQDGTANFTVFFTATSTNTGSALTGITINPSTAAAGTDQPFTNLPPAYIGGITMIRAA